MANLEKLAANYRSEGYSALLAEARVCQDTRREVRGILLCCFFGRRKIKPTATKANTKEMTNLYK